MIVFYGHRLFGKVDEVPGVFHVATKFFYVQYVPLIPTTSHLVIGQTKNQFRGVPIGLSFKSVLLAWLRVACILGALAFGVMGAVELASINEPYVHRGHTSAGVARPPTRGPNAVGVPVAASSQAPVAVVSQANPLGRGVAAGILLIIAAVFVGLTVCLWKLKWVCHASYARAMKLCEKAQLSDEARIMIERHFGRISEAESQAALAAAAADRAEMQTLEEAAMV